MKFSVPFLIAACPPPTAHAVEPAPARLIGYYSNMHVEGADDPHFISGYDIRLYQAEAETVGQVAVAIGSPEPVPATIRSLTYDPKKKLLTFTAEYSDGVTTNPVTGAFDREALQILTFSSVVRPQTISGKVGIKDFYCDHCSPVFRRITLKRISDMGSPGELQSISQ